MQKAGHYKPQRQAREQHKKAHATAREIIVWARMPSGASGLCRTMITKKEGARKRQELGKYISPKR
eukprot:scaffold972_cov21-Prasinocladus_malaysianus.AAC.1